MSGETARHESGWTVDTLKYYIEALLTEKDKALEAALVAVQEENRKTELGAEKRFDLLNELRDGVATKEHLEALEKIVDDLKDRVGKIENIKQGANESRTGIYAAIATVGVVLGIIVLLANGILR